MIYDYSDLEFCEIRIAEQHEYLKNIAHKMREGEVSEERGSQLYESARSLLCQILLHQQSAKKKGEGK